MATSGSTQACRFYTYAWLREDGTPFYIGKGCRGRAWVKHRNWNPPPKERVLILKKGLTDEEAIKHEIYLISVLGRKHEGGILNNLTAGGDGGANPSPSTRKKMSEWQKGVPKQAETCRKMSEARKRLPKPMWFHKDGVERFFREQPPEGWERGRPSVRNHQGWDRGKRVWWCNEVEEKWCEEPPGEGWRRGRMKGQKRARKKR